MRLKVARLLARTGDDTVISREVICVSGHEGAPPGRGGAARILPPLPLPTPGPPLIAIPNIGGAASRVLPKHPIRRVVEQVDLSCWPSKAFSCIRLANIREHEG